MQVLDRDSPIPYYHQLKLILLDRIRELAPAEGAPVALPTEKELQEAYGVSRSVVRQAIQELVHDGFVVRQQGRGTYALPGKVQHNPHADGVRTLGLSGYMKVRGLESGTRLLRRARTTPGEAAREALGLEADAAVLYFERLRLASEIPIGIQAVTVPWDLGSRLRDEDLTYGEGSTDYLRDRLGMAIASSRRTIEAVGLEPAQAELLGTVEGVPALRVRRVIRDARDRAVEYFDAIYRGDYFQYSLEFDHA
jgi:GntR family transcriptional regulator